MFGSTAKRFISNWSLTQSLSTTDQLKVGIRYFDLRIASKKNCDGCFYVHGLYGDSIEKIMKDIKIFLDDHPKEIVLLDLNHFYSLDEFKHKQFLSLILEILGYKMVPFIDRDSVTLDMLWENNLQVIVFYHNDIVKEYAQFWPGYQIPSPWPNTMSRTDLVSKLDIAYDETRKKKNSFFVFQGVLTPTTSHVIAHLNGSLKNDLASKASMPYVKWIKTKQAGKNGINVCIMDFVEDSDYIKTVIDLNETLAEKLKETEK